MIALIPIETQLRIVPVKSLRLHEEFDPYRVKRLVRAFERDGRLRNPIIVAAAPEGGGKGKTYIVLDGATRTSTLRELGVRDALVQVVDYFSDMVALKVWHHVLVGFPSHRLMNHIAQMPALVVQTLEAGSMPSPLEGRDIIARITTREGRSLLIRCEGDINCQAAELCRLVTVYRGKAEVHRTPKVDLPSLIEQFPDLSAVVAFPTFRPAEIIEIAASGNKVPMGITRHIINGRALGLGVSLERLQAEDPIKEKNAWLQEKIRQRIRANKVRFYQEPVIIFDE